MITQYAAAIVGAALVLCMSVSTANAGGNALSGEELFYMSCATCHVGASALMGLRPPPDLFRAPLGVGDSAEALSAVIRAGAGGGRMPSFGEGLDDAELRTLVAFIRSQRGH